MAQYMMNSPLLHKLLNMRAATQAWQVIKGRESTCCNPALAWAHHVCMAKECFIDLSL